MNNFSDLGVKVVDNFTHEKISINFLLNTEIVVNDYKIATTKNGERVVMSIETSGLKKVVFTGGAYIRKQLESVDRSCFPFKCRIVKDGERFVMK